MTWQPLQPPAQRLPPPLPGTGSARSGARQRFEQALQRPEPADDGPGPLRAEQLIAALQRSLYTASTVDDRPTPWQLLQSQLQQALRDSRHWRQARWRLVLRLDEAVLPLSELVLTGHGDAVQVQLRTACDSAFQRALEALPALAQGLQHGAPLSEPPQVLRIHPTELT